jgi:hypothetical protein
MRYARVTSSYVIKGSNHGNDPVEQCDDISDAVTSLFYDDESNVAYISSFWTPLSSLAHPTYKVHSRPDKIRTEEFYKLFLVIDGT